MGGTTSLLRSQSNGNLSCLFVGHQRVGSTKGNSDEDAGDSQGEERLDYFMPGKSKFHEVLADDEESDKRQDDEYYFHDLGLLICLKNNTIARFGELR